MTGRWEGTWGPALVAAGLLIAVVGVLIWTGGLSWFGHLPGDIRIHRGNVRIYIPWVSALVLSVVASLVLSLVLYFFRR